MCPPVRRNRGHSFWERKKNLAIGHLGYYNKITKLYAGEMRL